MRANNGYMGGPPVTRDLLATPKTFALADIKTAPASIRPRRSHTNLRRRNLTTRAPAPTSLVSPNLDHSQSDLVRDSLGLWGYVDIYREYCGL